MKNINNNDFYKIILNTTSDIYFMHDQMGNLLDVNQKACDSLGYARDELLKLNINDIEIGMDPEKLSQIHSELDREKKVQIEGVYRCKGGVTYPVEISRALTQINNETVFIVLARDISKRINAESELLNVKEEVEYANEVKSMFLTHMSHELRTPMNAIIGFSQLLLSDNTLSEVHKDFVKDILLGGNHLMELINTILELTAIESGKLESSPKDCNLNDMLEDCLLLIEPLSIEQGIRLINNISLKTNYTIHVDCNQFKQVMFNLLSNAIKYNKNNGTVLLSCNEMDDNQLRINVHDTGIGLSDLEQQRLFMKFERAAKYNGVDGAGIGLTTAKHFVESMGGTIGFESEIGKGSDFWVQIPLA